MNEGRVHSLSLRSSDSAVLDQLPRIPFSKFLKLNFICPKPQIGACSKQMEFAAKFCNMRNYALFVILAFSSCVISVTGNDASAEISHDFLARKVEVVMLNRKPRLRNLKQLLPLFPFGTSPAFLASGPSLDVNGVSDSNVSFVLAEHRTRRPDILCKFKKYEGGWNITSKHYWASVGFTGAPGFILAILWFASFGVVLSMLCCCRKRFKFAQWNLPHSYCLSLLMLILFTCAAVAGCTLLSMGQGRFHHEISAALGFVVKQSDFTVENLRNVSNYLVEAKDLKVATVVIPEDKQHEIDDLNGKLIQAADGLENKTNENAEKIQKSLDVVRDALIGVAAVMLLLSILGLLVAVLGFQHIIYILVFFGWLLVAGTFILSGVFTILNNAIADSCLAMQEWVDHPNAETTLDHILPCVNQSTSNQALYKTKQVTSELVNITNYVIRNVVNGNSSPMGSSQMPELCNPFNENLNDRECLPQEVNSTNAAEMWKKYVCNVTGGSCDMPGMITEEIYAELVTAVNLGYGLLHYAPFLLDLIDCSFVRDTFKTIRQSYCPELELYVKWIYIGLALLSVGIMLSLIFWIVYVHQTLKYKESLHHSSSCFKDYKSVGCKIVKRFSG